VGISQDVMHGQCDVRLTDDFPAIQHQGCTTSMKLYCLATGLSRHNVPPNTL